MIYELLDDEIYRVSQNRITFLKGFSCYINNSVISLKFLIDINSILAKVQEKNIYDIEIEFTDNSINFLSCTCEKASNFKACKHIIAVLLLVQEKLKYQHIEAFNETNNLNSFFSAFDKIHYKNKERINLDITYYFDNSENSPFLSSIELMIGQKQLYIVKNIKDFVEQIANQEIIDFGKNFVYDPDIYYFKEPDKSIINLLIDILKNEKYINNSHKYKTQPCISQFKGKRLYLSPYYLKILFSLLKDKSFIAYIQDLGCFTPKIFYKDMPIKLHISERNYNLILKLDSELPLPLTPDSEVYFYYENIFIPSESQQKYYPPLHEALIRNNTKTLVFKSSDRYRFMSDIFPLIKEIAIVTCESSVENSLTTESLDIKIFIDKRENDIIANLEFHYGNIIINPFSSIESKTNNIFLRDITKENQILDILEDSEFSVKNGFISLCEDDKIFNFFNNILPQLQKFCTIYYSDTIKNKPLKKTTLFSCGVKLNEPLNLLEFNFELEDIENDEFENILLSLNEKKIYHKLKDGTYLSLDSKDMIVISDILQKLDVTPEDISKNLIKLPAFKSLYLNNIFSDINIKNIQKSSNFLEMTKNMSEPENLKFEVPSQLNKILRDYQKIGFNWLKILSFYNCGGILADDMGLGKTLQILAFILSEIKNNNAPALIICPTSLVYNWKEEIEKFVPFLKSTVISGILKERLELLKNIENSNIVITSYPLIRRDIDLYKEITFSYCILDEAQHIKNPNTINSKSVKLINAKGYFALTGTPIENSLTELWSIFDFIMPSYLFSHMKFLKRFEIPIVRDNDKTSLDDLYKRIRPFILRRMKSDVLKELPEKIRTKLMVEMTPEQKNIYLTYLKYAKREVRKELKNNKTNKSTVKILKILMRLRQICCHPLMFLNDFNGESGKMQLLQEILENSLAGEHSILLFSQFTSMLRIIKTYLFEQKIEHFYLDGSTRPENRMEMVRKFNNKSVRVFLISLKAAGTGLNLVGADTVIHFDPWWNSSVEEQASDRAHRIGQKNVVQVMNLICKGTIEEKIYQLQEQKKNLIDSIILPGETILSKLSKEELINLFEIE